jgi:hypothetical protein
VTAVATVFLLGPGADSLSFGHVNFLVATALVVVLALVALPMPRVTSPLQLAALAGALVGVAHNWILLLTLAAPAALAAAFPCAAAAGAARSQGGFSYYFWEYTIALEITGAVLTVVVVALAVASSAPAPAPSGLRRRLAGVAGAVLLALGLTQVFGWTGPQLPGSAPHSPAHARSTPPCPGCGSAV